ncbi:hypothetical protein BC829DRAFT_41961 [Chytridium lagenaria]|nr:hypothetical protein BC829DRAFT_41961 [Chytridium lagenaria]
MVEIQYHCSPYYEQISSVRETGSCRYLIHVQTPRLCTDAAFLPKQLDQGTSIVCEPVLNTELLETSTSSKRGRETYTPPHASHIHFVSSSVPNQPKGLVGIRDLLAAEYISKATTAGKAAPLPRGHHSIQAILEENQMKKAAAGAAGVGAGAASVAEAVKGAATAAAGPFTVKFKNGAAVVAAPGGVMGAAAGGDGRDPLLANLLSSPEFSQIWKKVTSAVADALADEVEEEEKKPSAAKKEGEKVDDAEADARMKAFHQAIRAVAGEMGGKGCHSLW